MSDRVSARELHDELELREAAWGAAAAAWESAAWDGPGTFEAEQRLFKPAAQKFVAEAASVYRELFGVGLGAGKWRRGGGFAAYAARVKNGLHLMIETMIQELQLQDAPEDDGGVGGAKPKRHSPDWIDDSLRGVKREMLGCIDDGLRGVKRNSLDWIAMGCRRFWEHESTAPLSVSAPLSVWTGEVVDAPVENVHQVSLSAQELAAFKAIAASPIAQDLVFDEPLFNRFRECFWRAEWRGAGRGTAPHAGYMKHTMLKYMELHDALHNFLAHK